MRHALTLQGLHSRFVRGLTTWNLRGLPPKRDCRPERVDTLIQHAIRLKRVKQPGTRIARSKISDTWYIFCVSHQRTQLRTVTNIHKRESLAKAHLLRIMHYRLLPKFAGSNAILLLVAHLSSEVYGRVHAKPGLVRLRQRVHQTLERTLTWATENQQLASFEKH